MLPDKLTVGPVVAIFGCIRYWSVSPQIRTVLALEFCLWVSKRFCAWGKFVTHCGLYHLITPNSGVASTYLWGPIFHAYRTTCEVAQKGVAGCMFNHVQQDSAHRLIIMVLFFCIIVLKVLEDHCIKCCILFSLAEVCSHIHDHALRSYFHLLLPTNFWTFYSLSV